MIDEFPIDGIKCIEKLQSYYANMNFSDKSRYDSLFQQVTHKGGGCIITTFSESLELIFSQYIETCEVLLDYPKIGGEDIKDFAKIPLGIFFMQTLMYTAED